MSNWLANVIDKAFRCIFGIDDYSEEEHAIAALRNELGNMKTVFPRDAIPNPKFVRKEMMIDLSSLLNPDQLKKGEAT